MRRAWLIAGLLLLLGGGALWLGRDRLRTAISGAKTDGKTDGKGDGKPAGGRVIPVVATAVIRRDVPIYLDGLGSVIASKTVTVRPQVDGRLEKVLFREGQAVRRGDVIAQIDPRPFQIQLRQAEGALARDRATLESNQLNLTRNASLRERNLISQQQVDDSSSLVGQVAGTIRIDEAQVSAAKLNLEWARVTAPIDGVTGVRLVDPGNIVHATDATGLVVIAQLDPIAVLFTLPQDELPRVALELGRGPLTVEAFSRDGDARLAVGELALIDNQINQATSTIRLKATFNNPKRALWPNQFVKARLLVTTRKQAMVVPATVVQRGPTGTFAYIINAADQTVSVRPLEVELLTGDVALIAKGLTEGEQVVVDGQNQLRPGSKVSTRGDGKDGGKAKKQ